MEQAKREIIAAGQALAAQGLIVAADGNLSCRLDQERVLITASGVNKGQLELEQVLEINQAGELVRGSGQISIEAGLHLALYAANPAILAIIHAHPPYATAFALAGQALSGLLPEEARLILGEVPVAPYAPAGSAELAAYAAAYGRDCCAILLERHGAVSWGESMAQALQIMETVEQTARILLYRRLLT